MANIPINQLTAKNTLSAGDQVPIFSTTDGDARRASMTAVAAFVAANATVGGKKVTQYVSPTTPGTITVLAGTNSVFLLITPVGIPSPIVVALPAAGFAFDGQEVLILTTVAINAYTVTAVGLTVNLSPSTATAQSHLLYRFDLVTLTWYLVG